MKDLQHYAQRTRAKAQQIPSKESMIGGSRPTPAHGGSPFALEVYGCAGDAPRSGQNSSLLGAELPWGR
jgi:hypothetical protein